MPDTSYQPKVYKKPGGDELVVASGGKITVESGGEIEAQSGSVISLPDLALEAADIGLADGDIIIGDATGKGASQPVTGDVTMTRAGVTAIGSAKVTSAMLANGAGWAALLTAGLGASANYPKTTNGVQTLLASNAAARIVLIIVTVTVAFANGDGGQPTFKFGETDTDTKYAATSVLTGATLGAVKVFAGTLTANKALIVTAGAGTGTTETGAISVMAMVLPAAA